uniref:15-oxoprostaglandin 13-reductase n=1 Tax=Clastoptera arizonana TaxID=38151 RepID=A0A1B6E909_9HEMI
MVQNKRFIYASEFKGNIKPENFKLLHEELPALKNGEILCRATYLSVDPYMRAYGSMISTGETMVGSQIAVVVESKHKDYPVSTNVFAYFGWRLYTICNPECVNTGLNITGKLEAIPDFEGLPLSYALGALGMTGNTAYFGFLEICNPQPIETVVVSAAAGAVGSHVGQIAKIKGCKVIGIAGSEEKIKYLKEELKFDEAINYKTQDIRKELSKIAPLGIDCYFDNVGGEISSDVISLMRLNGRISACGSISVYNDDFMKYGLSKAPVIQPFIVKNQLKMEGFLVFRYMDRFHEGAKQNLQWIKQVSE